MKQLSRIFTLISALTGAVLAYADSIGKIPGFSSLPPGLIHAWPLALALAFLIHQGAAIIVTQLRDWKDEDAKAAISASALQPAQNSQAPMNPVIKAAPMLAIMGLALRICAAFSFILAVILLPSCAYLQTAGTKVNADVKTGIAWAQSPSGQQALNLVVDGFNIYANTAGGSKSKANAANVSTAVRSLEGGSLPSTATLASAITTYTGSGSQSTALVNSILATVSKAPSTTAGLEASAQKLDAISASPSPASASLNVFQRVRALCARPFVHYRAEQGLR